MRARDPVMVKLLLHSVCFSLFVLLVFASISSLIIIIIIGRQCRLCGCNERHRAGAGAADESQGRRTHVGKLQSAQGVLLLDPAPGVCLCIPPSAACQLSSTIIHAAFMSFATPSLTSKQVVYMSSCCCCCDCFTNVHLIDSLITMRRFSALQYQ